ncbi:MULTISPECIES: glycosyltransferase family 4 protein [unclassified Coleofasciculus]|uniref:glycosyltransferase family 4 protein n=1 Tax=unclassified Coleofasciculus TaxID=2692782 RepID=UPI00187DE1AC|nr:MULTISPECIES: glycosyltransferase family 4 protein [unclassified Coleofasciculus]MBE9125729.1 glycosyltransferase family 4 protein [Coleofasciculus sp. LEGE 07081]MBE9147217.1 glycosyltransferase family 4 protein [Coleofasciculus sp. LEGE 07092]
MSNGKTPVRHGRPIQLSIITQFYPPDYAATGQLIEELAVRLGKQSLFVQVFTGQPGYAFHNQSAPALEHFEGGVIQRSRATRIWSKRIRGKAVNGLLFCLRAGLHLLKSRSRGDILLVTTAPPFLPILGYLVKKLFNVPYVCLLYDLYPDVAVELSVISRHHWFVRLWDTINRRIWRQARQIIVLSPSMKTRITAKCPEVRGKISVIHNWADANVIVPIVKQENWFAQTFNLVDTFTVLYSGNMGRCHDMDTILEAAELLQHDSIQFVFIGNGAKRKAFESQATQLGLKNCCFLPYQDKQNLPYSLTACDLSLVSVSVGMEGLVAPSKLYAALAAGRPVAAICESHSYLRTIVTEAGCGEAFNNGDASGLAAFIRRLSTDTHLVKQMGEAGRYYLKTHFTPELIANQYSQLLHKSVIEGWESCASTTVGAVNPHPQPISHPKRGK